MVHPPGPCFLELLPLKSHHGNMKSLSIAVVETGESRITATNSSKRCTPVVRKYAKLRDLLTNIPGPGVKHHICHFPIRQPIPNLGQSHQGKIKLSASLGTQSLEIFDFSSNIHKHQPLFGHGSRIGIGTRTARPYPPSLHGYHSTAFLQPAGGQIIHARCQLYVPQN